MTPEDAEAALTGFMFGQASRLLASARRGNASTGTWKEWEEEWQAMFAALRKTWREASATEVSGPTGPARPCSCHTRGDCDCADDLFAPKADEEG